jgi:hypothetical protein
MMWLLIGIQLNFLTNTVEGMYVKATMMIPKVEHLSASVLYNQFYNDEDKHSDSERRDISFGIRYDINANRLVKGEYHDIQGTALNLGMVNDGAALSNDGS